MPIFAVMALGDPTALTAKIKEQFPNDHYVIDQDNQDKWFVVANGMTASAVGTKLGMTKTEKIKGVVVTFGGYYGYAASDIWEWVKAKGTQTAGG